MVALSIFEPDAKLSQECKILALTLINLSYLRNIQSAGSCAVVFFFFFFFFLALVVFINIINTDSVI